MAPSAAWWKLSILPASVTGWELLLRMSPRFLLDPLGACYGFVGMLIIGQPMLSATQANDRGCDAVSPLALSDYLPGTDPQYGAGRNAEGVLRLNHQDIAHPSVGIF
jgi:hypothetical protein